tara:strand:- start:130 stop:1029 length:900 start_codon:yes stop_codon:yes gene_type:complete
MVNNTLQLFAYEHANNFNYCLSEWCIMGIETECVTCANNDPRFQWMYTNIDDLSDDSDLHWFIPELKYTWGGDHCGVRGNDIYADKSLKHKQMLTKLMRLPGEARAKELVRIGNGQYKMCFLDGASGHPDTVGHPVVGGNPDKRAKYEKNIRDFLACTEHKQFDLPGFSLEIDELVNKADFPEIQFVEGEHPDMYPFLDNPRYFVCFYRSNSWMFVIDVKTMEIKSGVCVPIDDFEYQVRTSLVHFLADRCSLFVRYAKDRVFPEFIAHVNKQQKWHHLCCSDRDKYIELFGGKNESTG